MAFPKDNIFSGMIVLGLSHNVPMILQNKTNRANIPCISFNHGYSTVIDKVNDITDNDYAKLKEEINKFCNLTIEKNKLKLNNYINKVLS